ncbi:MAG: protein-L-isoaspartate O-methyltransferase [Deltaproteobacteria bacterium]|nr:protein-L-isoaspartate O-methyltransferase [Deltaproteobacteria bacterium]MBW1953391.1 protein-L-isoaspartate O-methyltransferase [Deltaproteobacteria bacterium]MBW1986502.1 protein-L-isoaspartate O-methyltransferase [Deltaproteobacteria bacterium]MBW2135080.1 protein-L-isoaspartate O-methyltransferase [Deltaproteobacteria bacterium]
MIGWIVPPPKPPTKTPQEFAQERQAKVRELRAQGFLRSPRLQAAMAKVRREEFIPELYRDYAYLEVPLPLPGEATISCPHSYPLFYEALELAPGQRFLEVGSGSGYGAALAWEVVRPSGLVVTIEIASDTLAFAQDNLWRLGYLQVVIVPGDGSQGYPRLAPYDRICFTAAAPLVPPPLMEQLALGGRLIGPVGKPGQVQDLVLVVRKGPRQWQQRILEKVAYIPLRGRYGYPNGILF